MEEKRGTLEATAESTAVSVGRSGKIRQKRAVSETKSEERCHWKKLAAVYFVLDCTPSSSGFPNLPRVTKTWQQKHSARAENEQWEDRCGVASLRQSGSRAIFGWPAVWRSASWKRKKKLRLRLFGAAIKTTGSRQNIKRTSAILSCHGNG